MSHGQTSARDPDLPAPSLLERRFASYLLRNCAQEGGGSGGTPYDNGSDIASGERRKQALASITRRAIALAALAGIISGGVIGGSEVWLRLGPLDGMEDAGWRETWPYWLALYAFVGVVSVIEIALLYVMTLVGAGRITKASGLALDQNGDGRVIVQGLARAVLEFPNPRMTLFGIDPHARVSNWKLTAINIAYKLKVGVSSFLLRVFLRRVAARIAVRGFVPLLAGPLYAFWNAYILWRIMRETRLRTLGPFAVDHVVAAHFADDDAPVGQQVAQASLQAAAEMLVCGRDSHSNQIYLMVRLAKALGHEGEIALDWRGVQADLATLERSGQRQVLDVMTVSCLVGAGLHKDQITLLQRACDICGFDLREAQIKALRRDIRRGHKLDLADLELTRHSAG